MRRRRSSAPLTFKTIASVRLQERIRILKKEGNWPPKTIEKKPRTLAQPESQVKTNKSE
jgi:hypothetical protein